MQLTQDDIELLEGFLINHFRYASDFFEGVSSARADLVADAEYESTMTAVFEAVLHTNHVEAGKLTHILRQSANWYVRSDKEARRKLAFIYEDTLEVIQIAQPSNVIDSTMTSVTDIPTTDISLLSHLQPTQLHQHMRKQEKWLATHILSSDIKSVANELENHYTHDLSITKDAFLLQVGVSLGVAVLSSVLASVPKSSQEQLRQALGKFCKRYKRHDLHTVLETALQMMYALDDTDETIATVDITLVLHYACQLLSDEDTPQLGLYDWFDLIFEGEALSNDIISVAPQIYQWIVLDLLPSASLKKLPRHILALDELIPTKSYLHTLSS